MEIPQHVERASVDRVASDEESYYVGSTGRNRFHRPWCEFAIMIPEYKRKRHEVTVAREQTFAPGTILVFDRGYVDFAWFARLTDSGVCFVMRMKDGTTAKRP